jgi:hypothetical protein
MQKRAPFGGSYLRIRRVFKITSTNGADAWNRQLKAGDGLRKGDASNHGIIIF